MADKAAEALKLAQKVEKDLKAVQDHLTKVEKNIVDSFNDRVKKLADAHNEQEKRFTDLHNEQNKKIAEVVAWAQKTFDTKGWF